MTEVPPRAVPPPAGGCEARADQSDPGLENAVLRELVTIYRQLSGLALQNADLTGVARLIADRTAATVAVVSPARDVLTAAAPGRSPAQAADLVREAVLHPRLGQVLRACGEDHRPLRLPAAGRAPAIIVAPILIGEDVPAHLITIGPAAPDPAGDLLLMATEHAAAICGVIMARERAIVDATRRVRDDLVEGLLHGSGRDDAETARWAAHLGYDPSREHNVLVIAFDAQAEPGDDYPAQRVREVIERFCASQAPGAIISARKSEVVLIAAAPGERHPEGTDARKLGASCVAQLAELIPGAGTLIGIGGTCREPVEIARSYEQARRTLRTLCDLGRPGGVAAFADLGLLRLLLQVPDLSELRAFADEMLGSLSRAEPDRRAEYLATLACYLRENSSPQRAARYLHVHPNTVAYRIRRIEEITGLSLDAYPDRLSVQVALEVLDALGDVP